MEMIAKKGRFVLWYSGGRSDDWVIQNTDTGELKLFDAEIHRMWLPLIGEFYWDEGEIVEPEDRRKSAIHYEEWVFSTSLRSTGTTAKVTWQVQRFHERKWEITVTNGTVNRFPSGEMEWRTAVSVLEVA